MMFFYGGWEMEGVELKLYLHENRKYQGTLLSEWLLNKAKSLGYNGGSVFKASSGFGRHGIITEEHYFELAGNIPVQVVFILEKIQAKEFLQVLMDEKLDIFYVLSKVLYGVANLDEIDNF